MSPCGPDQAGGREALSRGHMPSSPVWCGGQGGFHGVHGVHWLESSLKARSTGYRLRSPWHVGGAQLLCRDRRVDIRQRGWGPREGPTSPETTPPCTLLPTPPWPTAVLWPAVTGCEGLYRGGQPSRQWVPELPSVRGQSLGEPQCCLRTVADTEAGLGPHKAPQTLPHISDPLRGSRTSLSVVLQPDLQCPQSPHADHLVC